MGTHPIPTNAHKHAPPRHPHPADAALQQRPSNPFNQQIQVRTRTSLVPRRSKYRKAFKGRIPVHTGGSTAGTTLEHGDFGIRVKEPVRLSAKQLHLAQEALRRGIKPIKGSKVYLRAFPDIPVCIKGNETRMGKGKGTFEFWACRAPVGKVIFEVGGGGIAEQVAKDALRLASAKLPVTCEFVTRSSLPRVGGLEVPKHFKPQIPRAAATVQKLVDEVAPAVVAA